MLLLHPLQNDLRGASLQRITAATGANIRCLRVAFRLGQLCRQRCGRGCIGYTIVTGGHCGGQCTLWLWQWLLGHSDHAGR